MQLHANEMGPVLLAVCLYLRLQTRTLTASSVALIISSCTRAWYTLGKGACTCALNPGGGLSLRSTPNHVGGRGEQTCRLSLIPKKSAACAQLPYPPLREMAVAFLRPYPPSKKWCSQLSTQSAVNTDSCCVNHPVCTLARDCVVNQWQQHIIATTVRGSWHMGDGCCGVESQHTTI